LRQQLVTYCGGKTKKFCPQPVVKQTPILTRLTTADDQARGEAIRVELALMRMRSVQSITVDHVIIATGPAHENIFSALPYLNSLEVAGLVTPDALGLDLATDKTGRALDRKGQSQSRLFVGGPLARGTFGELMGLPEVANYAKQIATSILRSLEEDQSVITENHVLTA
jgi:uncharacterized NAD(P)/FAD-binding protein YdhS